MFSTPLARRGLSPNSPGLPASLPPSPALRLPLTLSQPGRKPKRGASTGRGRGVPLGGCEGRCLGFLQGSGCGDAGVRFPGLSEHFSSATLSLRPWGIKIPALLLRPSSGPRSRWGSRCWEWWVMGEERQEGKRVGQGRHQMPGCPRGPEVLTTVGGCKDSTLHCPLLSPRRPAAPVRSPLRTGDLRACLGPHLCPGWDSRQVGHMAPVPHCCFHMQTLATLPQATPPSPRRSGTILCLLSRGHWLPLGCSLVQGLACM